MNWNKEEGHQKTRDLPIYDYFEVLQKEYLVMEIRSKIYPTAKDKQYYKDIMSHKRSKIEDIARRNDLRSIFNDSDEVDHIEGQIFNKRGLPNFIYRDDKARLKFEEADKNAYYLEGASVKVYHSDDDEDFSIGNIVSCENDIVTVKVRGGEEVVASSGNITRIL